jgi:GT2 family glycosyltransferase/acetyltransferase-like isoleucine patch superfamily enzyme
MPDAAPLPDANAPELTVIIVSYNTRALTLKCLETLYATTRETRFHAVLLDNDSQDGSADAVAAAFPQVELIRSAENLGFARANNVVAERARTEWLLLLNPDTEVHDGAIDALLAFSKAHPEAGITGGRTVFPDGSLNIASCWMRITPWSTFCQATGLTAMFRSSEFFNSEGMGNWARDSVRQVDIVVGCFLMIPRALWDQLGGFDLKYFMYGEEADLCLRAAAIGYRPMITPDAEIMHLVGASANTRADKTVRVARARATLIRDHWPGWQVPFGLACMWLWAGGRRLATAGLALAGGARRAEAAARWRTVWQDRRTWLAGYTAPPPVGIGAVRAADATPRTPVHKRRMGRGGRLLRLIGGALDPRAWAHAVKLVNYYNYSHVRPLRQVRLGPGAAISPNAVFSNPERIVAGHGLHLGARCSLWAGPGYGRIVIGNDVLFGPDVMVTAANYRFNDGQPVTEQAMDEADVVIGDDVWIATGAVILPGVTIGNGAIIGAGALVNRDIPPMAIAVGSPARVVGQRRLPGAAPEAGGQQEAPQARGPTAGTETDG